ncbi:uncharacterized protein K02A2.6-like [Stylophora pistillata]|uniref:uncharacterized protein K02A2.6-like n=1 Tax=Stylophora pistillata TaxID=50429 RepID=UPI000C0501AD|nr:uncharacterized protein K02A2.6-like [Stylophora pistillata]
MPGEIIQPMMKSKGRHLTLKPIIIAESEAQSERECYTSVFEVSSSALCTQGERRMDELKRLVNEGLLKKVESSDWATPIVSVLKPDGTQVVLDEKSQPYVTINTHLGLYRYTRLPFGVAAAPAIFQQIIDKMLDGLTQTGGILDDLIVTGQSDEQHIKNLHHTLKKFEECGAKFKVSKCAIMQPKLEYFAFVLDREGIHLSQAEVQAVR